MRFGLFFIGILMLPTVQAGETGYTYAATELKARPFLDAEMLAKLPERAPVEIVVRQGAWMQVKAGDKEGWLRLLTVRLGKPGQKVQGGNFLTSIGFARPGGAATTTTGIRGFSEEDLKSAKPNAEQLKKMQSSRSSVVDATGFATSGKLTARKLPYYDEDGKPVEGANK